MDISYWQFDQMDGRKFKDKYILRGIWIGCLLIMFKLRWYVLPCDISISVWRNDG